MNIYSTLDEPAQPGESTSPETNIYMPEAEPTLRVTDGGFREDIHQHHGNAYLVIDMLPALSINAIHRIAMFFHLIMERQHVLSAVNPTAVEDHIDRLLTDVNSQRLIEVDISARARIASDRLPHNQLNRTLQIIAEYLALETELSDNQNQVVKIWNLALTISRELYDRALGRTP